MAHEHLLSACFFCLLCLTHAHCSEHNHHLGTKVKVKERDRAIHDWEPGRIRGRRETAVKSLESIYVDKLFEKFKNPNSSSLDLHGFHHMLHHLGIKRFNVDKEVSNGNESCIHAEELLQKTVLQTPSDSSFINRSQLERLCPLLLFHIAVPAGCELDSLDGIDGRRMITWLYATCSVLIISLCGLFGVFVIPFMGRPGYQHILQFLVALAVGTLCGDAMLHLLPHALFAHGEHGPSPASHGHDHSAAMWKGLAVLFGIVFFFFTEKLLMLGSEWRKRQLRNRRVQGHSHVQILNGHEDAAANVESECKHKYSEYPYCYSDIKSNRDGHEHVHRDRTAAVAAADITHEELLDDSLLDSGVACDKKAGEYDVIVREHTTSHHGHLHSHGHVHSAPDSLSSVAWMVILGDGLHNFTDGMAIGAAFSNNIAGGCSTAVAVFCHELPHELGDFAVLLKTGMTCKQAVLYNLLSSVLCFIGMVVGMIAGNSPEVTTWVFALSAGMFLYIALVDMFPEMTSQHSLAHTTLCQCSLQGIGMITGVIVMLVIAFYEDTLLNLFKD